MKKVLIGLGIISLISFALVFLVAQINPQGTADFFMKIFSKELNVTIDGKNRKVNFKELEEGLDEDDRLFLFQKLIALELIKETENKYQEESEEYQTALANAALDDKLTYEEFRHLKNMHREIVPDEKVKDWIKLAQELEKREKARKK